MIRLCHYSDEHGVHDVASLQAEAQRLLDEAQLRIEAQINRNVFQPAAR